MSGEGIDLVRLSPRRFWIIGKVPPMEIDSALGSVVDLDQGRVRWRLSGEGAVSLLSQVMAIDWDDVSSAPGLAVQSAIHHVPVLILRRAPREFEILVPRSFAQSLDELLRGLNPALP